MIPIPQELKGEKSIPFLEWFMEETILLDTTLNYKYLLDLHNIGNFYSQPFSVDMLTGKNAILEMKYNLPKDDNGFCIIHGNNNSFEVDYRKLTLNDFITLCTLAGVELIFK